MARAVRGSAFQFAIARNEKAAGSFSDVGAAAAALQTPLHGEHGCTGTDGGWGPRIGLKLKDFAGIASVFKLVNPRLS